MLQEKFRSYVRERSLCTADERILLAVSGGVDSMVMLSFVRCGYRVGVAHCNFQLRGREADEDDVLVEQQAARYGVPYFGARFDTLAEVAATGDSVEMAARRLRYGWFDKLCDEHRVRQDRHRSPCRRLGRDLFHQPDSRDRAARADRHPCGQRPADPSAAFLDAPRDRRLCPGQQDSLSGGLVERFDQIPAQQVPARHRSEDQGNIPSVHRNDDLERRAADFGPELHRPGDRTDSPACCPHRGRPDGDRNESDRSVAAAAFRHLRADERHGIQRRGDRQSGARVRRGARLGQALLFQRQRSLYRPGQDHRHADSRRRELRRLR